MKSFVYLSVFALIFTLSAFSIQDAFAVSVETDVPVLVTCTSSGQICSPLFSSTVETQSELKVKFTALPGHCSSVGVDIFLDGNPVGTTGFLGWPSAPSPFNALPLMSGIIDLGPVSPGTHQIDLQGKGQFSGCNTGDLLGWGGTLTTFTESLEQVVSGNILPLNTTSLLLAGVQTNLLWMIPTLAGLITSVVYLRVRTHND